MESLFTLCFPGMILGHLGFLRIGWA
uniref:Uncharacterized protein n=1 Tax=Medicago truncatula TaxID=3880 RepID=B7FFY5_MEDTR|nr:unknown [Medicago truncatula]